MIKECKKCGEVKRHNVRKSGTPQGWCADCFASYMKDYNKKNGGKHQKEYGVRKRQIFREKLIELKAVPCADCKVEYPHYVMQFDHVTEDKSFTIGESWQRSLEEIEAEAKKCEVVCANCHSTRTWERAHPS